MNKQKNISSNYKAPSAKVAFKQNLKKLIKLKGLTHADLAEMTEMSTSKIQRLSDVSESQADAAIDLNDADRVANALDTTVGYMCGSSQMNLILQYGQAIQEFAIDWLGRLEESKKQKVIYDNSLANDEKRLSQIEYYMTDALTRWDSLGHRNNMSENERLDLDAYSERLAQKRKLAIEAKN